MSKTSLCDTRHGCGALKEHYLIDVAECEDEVHHVRQGEGLQVEEGVAPEPRAVEDEECGDAADEAAEHDEGHHHQIGDTLENVISTRLREAHHQRVCSVNSERMHSNPALNVRAMAMI